MTNPPARPGHGPPGAGPLRILGLDPGLRRTGWGVVACAGSRLSLMAHGTVTVAEGGAMASRLCALLDALCGIVEAHAPHEAAAEEVFVNANGRSSLLLGQARACALLAPGRAGLPVAEYNTVTVKKAVVGTGTADKAQVGFMVRRLLPGVGEAGADACDALAVAVTHAHLRTARERLREAAA